MTLYCTAPSPLLGLSICDGATYAKVDSALIEFQSSKFLNWRKRPSNLQTYINISYRQVQKSAVNWGYNGADTYDMANIREYKVINHIVQEKASQQKDISLLDVGAGAKFQWVRAVANYLDKQDDLPEQTTIHLIGVTGEATPEPRFTRTKRCQIHCLSGFKIEELAKGLREAGFTQPIDLVFSRWTLTHLQDPGSDLEQILRIMRAGAFLFTDGFRVHFAGEKQADSLSRLNMVRFLRAGGVSYLRIPKESTPFDHFIIQRGETPNQFPYKYADQSNFLTAQLEPTNTTADTDALFDAYAEVENAKGPQLSGDAKIYSWFRAHRLFREPLPFKKP